MAETLSKPGFETHNSGPRTYEVNLTDEQDKRLQENDFDGVLQLGETGNEDVLGAEVNGMIVGFFWADAQQVAVVVPGSGLSKCLIGSSKTDQLDEGSTLSAASKAYAEVYEHRSYHVSRDRVEILEPMLSM